MPMSDPKILVTIVLSESTGSFLDLRQTNDELIEYNGSFCLLKSLTKESVKREKNCLLSCLFRPSKNYLEDDSKVRINTAYFSKNFDSDSQLSVNSYESFDSTNDLEVLAKKGSFENVEVFTRPLIILKFKSGEESVVVKDNTIIISLKDDQLSLVDTEVMCRICHGGDSVGDLLSPCRCKGTIALAHEECLERWLRESSNSYCELCKHHFQILRKPRYGRLWSVLVYLSNPGDNLKDLLLDTLAFAMYTPTTVISTYLLMVICENVAKTQLRDSRSASASMVAFCAIFGIAAIDFTYSSWLIVTLQKHISAWNSWYRTKSYLKVILPQWKRRPYKSTNQSLKKIKEH